MFDHAAWCCLLITTAVSVAVINQQGLVHGSCCINQSKQFLPISVDSHSAFNMGLFTTSNAQAELDFLPRDVDKCSKIPKLITLHVHGTKEIRRQTETCRNVGWLAAFFFKVPCSDPQAPLVKLYPATTAFCYLYLYHCWYLAKWDLEPLVAWSTHSAA